MTLKNWGKAACWRRNVQEVVRPFKILRCGNLPSLCYHLPFNASLAHKSNSSILLFTLLPYLSHKKKKTNKQKKSKQKKWLSHFEVRNIFADFYYLGFFLFIPMTVHSRAVVVALYLGTAITRNGSLTLNYGFWSRRFSYWHYKFSA